MKKVKLSDRHKKIIRLMREHWSLHFSIRKHHCRLLHPQHNVIDITIRDEKVLFSKGLITELDFKFEHNLTDLGKTINID